MKKPIILSWPTGGMGHSIYTLLCLCSKEVNSQSQQFFPSDGSHWHDISKSLHTDLIVKSHPDVHPDAVTIGSKNYYLIKLLSLRKWIIPHEVGIGPYGPVPAGMGPYDIHTPEQLELLHLWLNKWKPVIQNPDFEIEKLFTSDAANYVDRFIKSLELTPNNNVGTVIKHIVQNNKRYYNRIQYLQQVAQMVKLNKQHNIKRLEKYEQALLMTMIHHNMGVVFKLVHNSFETTQDIWDSMENTYGKTVRRK
jgi:hypothetical protein